MRSWYYQEKIHESLISRIKILSDLKIDENAYPKMAGSIFSIDESEIDLRVSTLPTAHGEKGGHETFKKTNNIPTLDELGLRGRALKISKKVFCAPTVLFW